MNAVAVTLSSLFLTACSVVGIRSGYEMPDYSVLETLAGDIEIRRYEPRLAAQTTVESADPEAARNEAFGRLAGYIFGENRASEEIAMTAPVEVERASTRIGMTSPVATEEGDGSLTMRFFMPSRFDRESLPEPLDSRIEIGVVPEETLAALRFSGTWSPAKAEARKQALLAALEGSGWRAVDEPHTLYYDPPFTLPFLRRNEAVVRVAR